MNLQIIFKKILFLALLFFFQSSVSQDLITGITETDGHRPANIGELVTIDSSESVIEGRSSLNYIWTLISKPDDSEISLFSVDEATTSFVPDRKGTYIVRLYIYANGFVSDHKDTVIVVQSPNIRPVAVAGANESVRPGTLVDLSASESFHFGKSDDLNYEWALDSIPQGSSAQIYFPNKRDTSFHADAEGIYLVRLIVNSDDSNQLSLPSYKVVRAEGAMANPPVANAGQDKAVLTGENLSLTGTVAYTGTETLSYLWKVESSPSASNPQLTNPETLTPTFTTDRDGIYLLSFRGEAGSLKGVPDLVRVLAGRKLIALALDFNIIGLTNQAIPLDSSESFDPNGLSIAHVWSILERPQGSSARVANPTGSITSFLADTEGNYVLGLHVENPHFSANQKQIRIRLISPSSFQAEAGNNQVTTAGSLLSLSASSSTGSDLNYFWSLIDKPSLSQAEVTENQSLNTNILLDKTGAYVFRLEVEKEGFLSTPDYVVFNSVLPTGTETFNESFSPDTASLALPISECTEVTRTITVTTPETKNFFMLFENQGVDEMFVSLNGKALTGRLEHETNTFIYPLSLEESNTLSLRLRGLSSNQLRVKVIEKSPSQTFDAPPALTAGNLNVSLGHSGSVSITGGTGLTYSILESPAYGTASVNSSGMVTYNSDGTTFATEDFILVKAVDSNGLASVILIKALISPF